MLMHLREKIFDENYQPYCLMERVINKIKENQKCLQVPHPLMVNKKSQSFL